jgi:hypothetical protein
MSSAEEDDVGELEPPPSRSLPFLLLGDFEVEEDELLKEISSSSSNSSISMDSISISSLETSIMSSRFTSCKEVDRKWSQINSV